MAHKIMNIYHLHRGEIVSLQNNNLEILCPFETDASKYSWKMSSDPEATAILTYKTPKTMSPLRENLP